MRRKIQQTYGIIMMKWTLLRGVWVSIRNPSLLKESSSKGIWATGAYCCLDSDIEEDVKFAVHNDRMHKAISNVSDHNLGAGVCPSINFPTFCLYVIWRSNHSACIVFSKSRVKVQGQILCGNDVIEDCIADAGWCVDATFSIQFIRKAIGVNSHCMRRSIASNSKFE